MWNTGWRLFLKSPHSAVTCTALQQSKGAGAFKAGTFISNQTYDVTIFVWPVLCQVTTVKWLCLEDPPPPKKTFSGASLQNSPVCDPGFSIVLYIFVAISGKTKSFGINKVLLHLFFCYFFHFKTSCHLLQLFRRMLQHWFAVKLQKCFVNYETFNRYASE